MSLLSFFSKAQHSALPLKLHTGKRLYCKVTDPVVANKMLDWLIERKEAEKQISNFFRRHFGLHKADLPFYKVDDSGKISFINFRYNIPMTHEAWRGKNGSHWLEPETHEVQKQIQMLPALPSKRDINALINWPEPCIEPAFADRHLSGYDDFAHFAIQSVDIMIDDGEIIVSVPYPETFRDYSPYMEAVLDWDMPEFLHITEKPHTSWQVRIKNNVSDFSRRLGLGGN